MDYIITFWYRDSNLKLTRDFEYVSQDELTARLEDIKHRINTYCIQVFKSEFTGAWYK